jgi:hypothetical protein
MRRALRVLALVIPLAGASGTAAATPRVLLWPHTPEAELAAAEREALARGVELVDSAQLWRQLEQAAEALARDEERLFARIDEARRDARRAFLEQRFDEKVEILAKLEAAALELLSRPAHVELLWEVQLARGLAYLYRGDEDDQARARERFELCVALAPDRAPARELYGPDVAQAFAQARAARDAESPRPTAIRARPPDARVTVDGQLVLDLRRPRALRPGLHVVRASAPGFQPRAQLVRVEQGEAIELALEPSPTGDPVARLAAGWRDGEVRAATASGRSALTQLARSVGADHLWLVAEGDARIRDLDVARPDAVAIHADVAAATRALRGQGDALVQDSPTREPRKPLYRRWQLWAGAGVVAAAATGVALGLSREPARLIVTAPER